jgi:hypothetical protein
MQIESPWTVWGNIAVDGDVVPFSRVKVKRGDKNRNNKRHHFVSVTYMNGFTDDAGKIRVYRSEAPEEPIHVKPAAIGFEKYYYSKDRPEGGEEHHELEDLWAAIEEVWPATLRAVRARRLSPAISFNVLGMVAIMKTRVPAARDRNSLLMAAELRASMEALERIGKLPTEYQIYAGKLDTVPVAANPKRTLAKIFEEMKEIGDLYFRMGFEVFHNSSDLPFITSDNPVCFYNPVDFIHRRSPYDLEADVELIFPLDAHTALRGNSKLKPVNQIVRHRQVRDASAVRRLNRTIAQFGYRYVIAADRSSDDLAGLYAQCCPTVEIEVRPEGDEGRDIKIIWRHVFGPRPQMDTFVNTPEKAARVQADMEARGIV